ncbi:MAG: RNB domain-containing ribonuclease [Phycisphaerales bacterium]|nr:RNB domain-containing ribonuclease [Phycisphaerales bacterium]
MTRFAKRILQHISDRRYVPTRAQELAESLGIAPDELNEFQRTVAQLASEGQVLRSAQDDIALPPPGREMIGIFRKASRGFGFIVPESPVEHGDLFVPAHMTFGAFTGDRVRARVVRDEHRATGGTAKSPFIGRILEILQRSQNRFVGNLRKLGSHWVVDVDGQTIREPVIVRDAHTKSKGSAGPKPGEKVVVELLEYPKDDKPAVGVIVEVLGEQGEPDVETLGVMRAHGLQDGFPDAVVAEARMAAQSFSDSTIPADRIDLTGELIITIDPPDAKDYDDAISIRRLDLGHSFAHNPSIIKRDETHPPLPGAVWELGVHIAHVAHFVKRGSAMDEEAYKRGNSTYLPVKWFPCCRRFSPTACARCRKVSTVSACRYS